MASDDAKFAPGGHYSGRNPVPNIQKFIENMDRDKKNRDAELMAQQKAESGDVDAHKDKRTGGPKGHQKTVTDPTTGKQVQIEDVDENFMEAATNPKVSRKAIVRMVNCLQYTAVCAKCESRETDGQFLSPISHAIDSNWRLLDNEK